METNYYFDDSDVFRPFTVAIPANKGSNHPLNALRIKPGSKSGYWPCEKSGKWTFIEDHRGERGYVDGKEFEIKTVGPYPNGWSKEEPPKSQEEQDRERLWAIDGELISLDNDSVRPLREINAGVEVDYNKAKLARIDAQIAELREERKTLTGKGVTV